MKKLFMATVLMFAAAGFTSMSSASTDNTSTDTSETTSYCDDMGRDCTMACMRGCGSLDPGECLGICVAACCGWNMP